MADSRKETKRKGGDGEVAVVDPTTTRTAGSQSPEHSLQDVGSCGEHSSSHPTPLPSNNNGNGGIRLPNVEVNAHQGEFKKYTIDSDDDDDDDGYQDEDASARVAGGDTASSPPASSSSSADGSPNRPAETDTSGVSRMASPAAEPIGSVGLVNEGATCYLNSLLQLLFHISYFRSAVYRIPSEQGKKPTGTSVPRSLQELFFQMQERTTPARAKKLTEAFGWGEEELVVQQDIQEMATVLRDNLEERMKGTVTEGAIKQLFEGCGEQVVETLDRTYTSRNTDVFYDIHLPLGEKVHTLMDSLRSLTTKDQLVGDNKYRVEREGQPVEYKDAEKGYEFKRFPPIVWFHVKRFAMDLTSPTLEMKKINSRLEFPVELDLTQLEKGLSPKELAEMEKRTKLGSAVQSLLTNSPPIYDLHGVIVHRGTVRSGHYYCYIRDWDPQQQAFTRWVEFEDENTTVVPQRTAVENNYGDPDNRRYGGTKESGASAYILSYVRRADAPVLLAPSPTNIISQSVKDALQHALEEEERQLKEEEEIKRLLVVYLVTDRSLARHCQVHQVELLSRDSRAVRPFVECVLYMRKTDTLATLYEKMAAHPGIAEQGITASECRLWRWGNVRLFHPTTPVATYAEATRRGTTLSDILTHIEREKPLGMTLYVQMPMPLHQPLTAATGPAPFIQKFTIDEESGACQVIFREPMKVRDFSLCIDTTYVHFCRLKIMVGSSNNNNNNNGNKKAAHKKSPDDDANASGDSDKNGEEEEEAEEEEEEQYSTVVSCTFKDGTTHVMLEKPIPVAGPLTLHCYTPTDVIKIVDVHFAVDTAALQPPVPLQKCTLSKVGTDRILLFFKFFDHTTCNVRYIGSMLVDRIANLSSCEPFLCSSIGFDKYQDLSEEDVAGQGGLLSFFEEGKACIARELSGTLDLAQCGLASGVIVAQRRFIPPVYRHLSVQAYYRTLTSIIDLRIVEVVTEERDATEEFQAALQHHHTLRDSAKKKKLAAAFAAKQKQQQQQQEVMHAEERKGMTPTSSASPSPSLGASPPPTTSGASAPAPAATAAGTAAPTTTTTATATTTTTTVAVVDPDLDPYNTSVPIMRAVTRHAKEDCDMCRALMQWTYETVCDAIGETALCEPQRLRLYRCDETGAPSETPLRAEDAPTLEEVLYGGESYSTTKTIYYELLAQPRVIAEKLTALTVTLRDAEGHALHRERYVLGPKEESMQSLAGSVQSSVAAWEYREDPWGTLKATVNATHYILVAVDKRKRVIYHIHEISMTAQGPAEEVEDDWYTQLEPYELDLLPAAPLQPGQQRIACCHGERRQVDAVRTFGHPFVITVGPTTTVREGMQEMLRVTNIPLEALNHKDNWAIMMLTDMPRHFREWDTAIQLFWLHTHNSSGHIPSLVLNHAAPKEKPGSRYVAQNNPTLKISST